MGNSAERLQPRAELLSGEADEENAAGRWRENSQREKEKKKNEGKQIGEQKGGRQQ